MNRIVEELKKVRVFYVATVDGNEPKVRPFGAVGEFEGHAYICTGRKKDVYKQLLNNPNVELCGMYEDGAWLRVSAVAETDNRIEAEQAVLDDPTGPTQLYKAGDGNFVVLKLTNIKAIKYTFTSAPEEIKE